MKLSENFTLEEFIVSTTAARHGIDNTPTKEIIINLTYIAHKLELIREVLGYPIHILSGYRCEQLNDLVKGQPNSAHKKGLAIDWVCPGFGTPLSICNKLQVDQHKYFIGYDQLIYEFNSWVHLGFVLVGYVARNETLTINSAGTFKGLV